MSDGIVDLVTWHEAARRVRKRRLYSSRANFSPGHKYYNAWRDQFDRARDAPGRLRETFFRKLSGFEMHVTRWDGAEKVYRANTVRETGGPPFYGSVFPGSDESLDRNMRNVFNQFVQDSEFYTRQ